jgi:hypothetical protein
MLLLVGFLLQALLLVLQLVGLQEILQELRLPQHPV